MRGCRGMSRDYDKHRSRRRALFAALAVVAIAIGGASFDAGAAARGGGVGPGGGGGRHHGGGAKGGAFSGQGMWIWYVSQSNGGRIGSIIRKAKSHDVRTLFIKSADAGNVWSQFTPALVKKFHHAHLNVCGWQFVYGTRPTVEALAGAHAKKAGADCLVIDAESSYEGRYAAASTYMRVLRKHVGGKFPIGLASFPYVDYHPGLPFSVFLGPGGAQQNLPQLYWQAIGTTVATGYAHTFTFNRVYRRPIEPLGQTYDDPPVRELKLFRRYARAYHMNGYSWWDWQATRARSWDALGAQHLVRIYGVGRGQAYPTLGHKYAGDLVVWAQEHLNGAKLPVHVTGKLNVETSNALLKFQKRHGLPRSGILDVETWKKLLRVKPVMVNWARRHGKAPAAPSSASLPAVRDEIPDLARAGR
jgi:Putative peptidoglycan binding domain